MKENITEQQAIALLKKYIKDPEKFDSIFAHAKRVQKLAVLLASKINKNGKIKVDIDFVKIGALLHDIGRSGVKYGSDESIKHGIIGGKILRKEGLLRYAKVAERHIGVGLSKEDVVKHKLDIPAKDYIPESIEEKIIAYCDNLDFGGKIRGIEDARKKFEKFWGKEYGKKIMKMHKEMESFKN